MKYEVGEVLSEERLPAFDRLEGDRRDGAFFRVWTDDWDAYYMIPLPCMGLKVVASVGRGSPTSKHQAAINFAARAAKQSGFSASLAAEYDEVITAQGVYRVRVGLPSLSLDSSLFDAGEHFAKSRLGTPRNCDDFRLLAACFSGEWASVTPAVLLSDLAHVRATSFGEPWWQSISPFREHYLNEMARNALWWGQLMLSVGSVEPTASPISELF